MTVEEMDRLLDMEEDIDKIGEVIDEVIALSDEDLAQFSLYRRQKREMG